MSKQGATTATNNNSKLNAAAIGWETGLQFSFQGRWVGYGRGGEGMGGGQREPNLTNIFYSFFSLYHLFVVRSSLLLSRVLLTIIFFVYKRKL